MNHPTKSFTADPANARSGKPQATATLVLRRRHPLSWSADTRPLSAQELGERAGAAPEDVEHVRQAMHKAGMKILGAHAASRRVRISGPSATIRTWADRVPDDLAGIVTAVLCGAAPLCRPRFLVADPYAAGISYTPLELARIYGMPPADGGGQRIAIIELGGGFSSADLEDYFGELGLPVPAVQVVGVDGADNAPSGDPNGADGEVTLDIEVAGAIAPAATLVVYFTTNTDAGFLDAVSAAAHASPPPTCMSISWGQSEDQWPPQALTAMDDAFADAAAMGITVTSAAGDNGSSDNDAVQPGPHTDFPASSPHVLACGGTSLQARDGREISEAAWNDGGRGGATGGGVSDVFPLPDWQRDAGVPPDPEGRAGRGVPDVAADADPQTGYRVLVDGQRMVVGGTSAVAPLWAGLVVRIAQLVGQPLGLAQTALYAGAEPDTAVPQLRDITRGGNGVYDAGPGWDPCTGLGVPDRDTPAAFARRRPPGDAGLA